MDEFGVQLSDDAIKNLFQERPPYENEALCELFDIKMSLFDKYFPEEVCESKIPADEIDRLFYEKFYKYDPEETRKKWLAEYESKLSEEELKKVRKLLDEPPPDEEHVQNSYLSNNPDEDELANLANTFQDQYRYLYPDGPRHILCLPNEHGVPKIVSTTLCPYFCTCLKLRSWEACAQFVADFLNYEPLEAPPISPTSLVSPELTMKLRRGNSLNFSTVLCSILISVEYDAFVVQGYAAKTICEMDMSKHICPGIIWHTKNKKIEEEAKNYAPEKEKTPEKNKYVISGQGLNIEEKSSKYLEMVENRKQEYVIYKAAKEQEAESDRLLQLAKQNDIFFGKRIHFWVLVRPGRRDISEAFFLEPSTGEKFDISHSEYMGIEFVWNHHNFWLNKQRTKNSCRNIEFNLDDVDKWDYFLPINSYGENLQSDSERLQSIPMPPSWVKCYDISSNELLQPLPEGKKVIQYHKAKLEKFNEFVLEDGCIVRKTLYDDEECQIVHETQEIFENRNDLLIFRQVCTRSGEVKEIFEEERNDALKEHTYNTKDPKSTTEMIFYPDVRADGLIRRIYTDEYVEDEYVDRKDSLIFRKETYLIPVKESQLAEDQKPPEIQEITPEKESTDLLTPHSFDDLLPMLPETNFSTWKFEEFLDMVDPEYRYFSDSDVDDDDDDIIGEIDFKMTKPTLSEEKLDNDYKIWLSNLREDLEKEKRKELTPIYENLSDSKDALLSHKRVLNRKIRDGKTQGASEEESQVSSKKNFEAMINEFEKNKIEAKSILNQSIINDRKLVSLEEPCEKTDNEKLKKKRVLVAAIKKRKYQYKKKLGETKLLLDIYKIYERNPSIPAEKDIHRRRFILDEGIYTVEFFPPENRLSGRSVIFIKPEVKSEYFIQRFGFSDELYKEIEPAYETHPFSKLYVYRELLRLIQNEDKLFSESLETIQEIEAFENKLKDEKGKLVLIPDLTNVDRRKEIQVMKQQNYMEAVLKLCKMKEVQDYLTPAFAEVGYKMPLDEDKAKKAYEHMIDDYLSSVNKKIAVFQKKLQETAKEHRQKIQAYNDADEEEITSERLETLEEDCNNVDKTLSVLFMRCERFQEVAYNKYCTLKENLVSDLRLQSFTKKSGSQDET